VNEIQSVVGKPTDTSKLVSPSSSMGKDDFLRLLVAQLKYQDPMKPMEDKDFMGQMAQFSSLEQINNLAQSMEGMRASNQVSQSVALIGHSVTYVDANTGLEATGVVDSVALAGGTIGVRVGGITIAPEAIQEVA
jgi:flagellar basal-body rod modification protein FlgD